MERPTLRGRFSERQDLRPLGFFVGSDEQVQGLPPLWAAGGSGAVPYRFPPAIAPSSPDSGLGCGATDTLIKDRSAHVKKHFYAG
jgi:hypothetical protein